MVRVFNGVSFVVEIDVNYKGRVVCGFDEVNNWVNFCFISSVSFSDGGIYFVLILILFVNILYVMGK